jgi:hypothetical protein
MTEINRHSSNEQVLEAVLRLLDVLTAGDYEIFGSAVGYLFGNGEPGECVRRVVEGYRSPEFYPGVDTFLVTDWREAKGGNPKPRQEIIWYSPTRLRSLARLPSTFRSTENGAICRRILSCLIGIQTLDFNSG